MRTNRINFDIVLNEPDEGLSFGTDALLLAAYIRRAPSALAAEFGAGSGAISLICAGRGKFARVDAYEIQPAYSDILLDNIRRNCAEGTVEGITSDIRQIKGERYDVVFTNPPYMKGGSGAGRPNISDLKNIARHEENGDIFDFCAAAFRALKYGGVFYAVYRPDRLTDLLDAMRGNSIEPKRLTVVCRDDIHSPSAVLVEGKKGASASLYMTPVLLMTGADGEDTEDMKFIYETGDFSERFQKP